MLMLAERRTRIVLVVEDDRRVGQTLSRILARSGYEVQWAVDAADAVRKSDRTPDVALLDLHLPDGNGVDVADVLRARYPGLPMLLMTGTPFRVRERPDGVRYFQRVLEKPLDLTQLTLALSAALNEGALAHERVANSG
jgi:DNA-binding response OmpR family regulator